MTTALLVLFPALMVYAAISDLLTMRIPNRLSLALLTGFAVLAVAAGLVPAILLTNLLAFLAVLAVAFALFALGWIGGGDAKLAAATALWLGLDALFPYLFIAALAGGVLTLAILALRLLPLPERALGWPWLARLHDRRSGVPYGIALAAGGLLAYPQTAIWHSLAG